MASPRSSSAPNTSRLIALQTGRAKDKARPLQFIEEGALKIARFQDIVRRHGLVEAWTTFERQFLAETP